MTMFSSVLIANRGEIACRVIRTCRRLGVRAVAVYSAADRAARHVLLADAAVEIGPAPSRDSYLRGDRIIAAAQAEGAEAVHPGYGFLSENPDFAEACDAAGLAFVGPPAAAIRAMGLKAAAKAGMAAAGVPLLPGYNGDAQDDATLVRAAAAIGFPLLVKPSAGGGGKGMQVVADAAALADAIARARREAKSSFGDDRLILERFLAAARHVEVQVFADGHGNAVHLFERDCSLQRRWQKVVEEAPAPGVDEGLRARMGAAAVAAARAVGYRGAGTVEFLLDGRDFYFMEMNTRLQVEHPVTEMVTGLDLVEWQLRVAAGEALPPDAGAVRLNGHAVEARLYAEDPARDFAPSAGALRRFRLPAADAALRIDTGYGEGDTVPVHYDPLIAKVVAWGPDRAAALARLRRALAAVQVAGPDTNLPFLRAIADHPDVRAGAVDTRFLDRHHDALAAPPAPPPQAVLALAALAVLGRDDAAPASPWARRDGWRLNAPPLVVVALAAGEAMHRIAAEPAGSGWTLAVGAQSLDAAVVAEADGAVTARIGGRTVAAGIDRDGDTVTVWLDGGRWTLRRHDPLAAAGAHETASGRLAAWVPGIVVAVHVAAGDRVAKGQPLLVLEAMKVEHTIRAPADGTVEAVRCAVGDQVAEGAELVAFIPDPA